MFFSNLAVKGLPQMPLHPLPEQLILFSSTSDVEKNLETLVDFVQEPYFSEKTVEKEKGIIGQEITMYDDNPDWRLYFGLIRKSVSKPSS